MANNRERQDTNKKIDQQKAGSGRAERGTERVPMGSTLKLLHHGMDPNYHYRWMSAADGRLEQAQGAWYEFVLDEAGNKKKRTKGASTLYLMRLPMEFHQEDQKLKERRIIDTLNKEQVLEDGEYLPDDRRSVLQKDNAASDDFDPLG
ncbi:MAG: hypothetical protein Unbinned6354contig1000_19 [Prokaryotic dsDNA virus sp.]|nr:hypothetical protein [Cytophagaceae bacterium]QDP54316.1 MAG: hypothetical protein Unbinned6354contig1000_19 [Prokaryotic dsDNA virus sp.]|tara:strand:+ start:9468 stop:9911 length:444 start_codon:yes stop_codon:yes gene_type:complete